MASLFQFSIRTLLVAVTIAAVGVAALLNANHWWEAGTWLVALGLLGSGILLSIYRRDEQRAYWLGFAIFGGLYLGLLLFAALIGRYYELAPSQLLQLAYQSVIPAAAQSQYVPPSGSVGSAGPAVSYGYTVVTSSPYSPPLAPAWPAPPIAPMAIAPGGTAMPLPAPWTPNADYIPMEKFVSIGNSLWLLLAAAIGGKICQWMCRTQPPQRSHAAP